MASGLYVDDPWQFTPDSPPTRVEAGGSPPLRVEVLGHITPLDAQFVVFPKKTVPDALNLPLYDQPPPSQAE